MPAKDPERRKEIARLGALIQHRKYGCLIPTEARRKGGRIAGKHQKNGIHQNHGLTEKKFDEWAESKGYKIYKYGFPDRAIEKDGEIIFVEIKRPKEKLSEKQRQMHELFRKLGLKLMVWRPQ